MMGNDPVKLDERRDATARKETEIRRRRSLWLQSAQAIARRREEKIEKLFQAPAETWTDAAAKARYLIERFALTPHAQAPGCKARIAQAIVDLSRLSRRREAPL